MNWELLHFDVRNLNLKAAALYKAVFMCWQTTQHWGRQLLAGRARAVTSPPHYTPSPANAKEKAVTKLKSGAEELYIAQTQIPRWKSNLKFY